MKNLPPLGRSKAIEIANALLARGCDESKAIRIAIAQSQAPGPTAIERVVIYLRRCVREWRRTGAQPSLRHYGATSPKAISGQSLQHGGILK